MICPNCGGEMRYDRSNVTHAGNVAYDAKHYECRHDGTWITSETPQDTDDSSEE